MKVALVLTGLMRCWQQAYPVFKSLFIDRYDCDVYIHTWSEVGYYTGKGYLPEVNGYVQIAEGDRGFHNSGEIIDINRIYEAYKPTAFCVEDFSKYEPAFEAAAKDFTNAYTRPKNTIAQAYKMAQGMLLIPNLEHYDLVVRARPDIVLEHDPGLLHGDHIWTLPSRNKLGKGTGDGLMIGRPDYVDHICQTQYRNLHQYYHGLGVSCPHMFLEAVIKDFCMRQLNGADIWHELPIGAHIAHSPKGLYQEPE